jgi:hypothetical protein
VIVDLTNVPLVNEKTPRFALDVQRRAVRVGLGLRLVGTPEVQRVLRQFEDTGDLPFYLSVQEARDAIDED